VADNGSYQTSISVEVPAFHEIAPVIRLVYDSNAGNGPLGLGWSLVASSQITRTSRLQGVPHYDATDQLWLDGMELLPCAGAPQSVSCSTGGTHTTRVEGVTRIVQDTAANTWTVWRRDGTRSLYSPEFRDVTSPTDTLRWLLTAVVDTHGNRVTYSHICGAGFYCYISDISYGEGKLCKPCESGSPDTPILPAGSPLPGVNIHFYWEGRPDPVSLAIGDTMQEIGWRLRAIDVHEGTQRVRVYQVNYQPELSSAAGYRQRRSWIESVQLFGSDAVVDASGNVISGTALPPNHFEAPAFLHAPAPSTQITLSGNRQFLPRPPAQPDLPQTYAYRMVPRFPPSRVVIKTYRPDLPSAVAVSNTSSVTLGDFDGDRKLDFMHWNTDAACAQLQTRTVLANWPTTALPRDEQYPLPASNRCMTTTFPADLDGDGRTDVLFLRYRRVDPFNLHNVKYDAETIAALSNGDGSFSLGPPTVIWTSVNEATILQSRCGVGDFNGDGRGDLTCTVKDSGRWLVYQAVSTGFGHFRVGTDYQANTLTDAHMLAIADANGDGLSDLIVVDRRGSSAAPSIEIKVGVSLGWPFLWRSQITSMSAPDATQKSRVLTGDFNGDGRADVAVVIADGGGSGGSVTTFSSDAGVSHRFRVNRSMVSGEMPMVSVGDYDGDRLDDLIFTVSQPAATCHSASGLAVSFADGSGKFGIPTAFNTCYKPTEMPWVGDWEHDASAAYVNGDHTADLFEAYDTVRVDSLNTLQEVFALIDRPSPLAATDYWRWQSTDINGDGVPDWLYVNYANPGLIVDSVITQPDGTRRRIQQTIAPGGGSQPDLAHVDPLSNVMLADIGGGQNGAPDGRVDVVVTDDATKQIVTLLSNGDGSWRKQVRDYGFTPTTILRGHLTTAPTVNGWRALDVNGDGRADLVHIAFADVGTGTAVTLHVTTLRSAGDGTWLPPVSGYYGFRGNLRNPDVRGFHPADINGDGRTDLVDVRYDSSLPLGHNAVVLSLIAAGGGTWDDVDATVTLPSQATDGWLPMEVNGDSRTDLAYVGSLAGQPLTVSSMLSLGNGRWQPVENRQPEPAMPFDTEAKADFRTSDVDGDGKQDIVRITRAAPTHGATTIVWNRYPHLVQTTTPALSISTDENRAWNLTDIDADGHPELVRIQPTVDTDLDVVSLPVPESRMTLASNGMGASDEISYTTVSEVERNMPLGALPHVVATVGSRAESGGSYAAFTTYTFSHAAYSYAQRQFLGFSHVERSDGQRIITADLELTDECGARRTTDELFDPHRQLIERTKFTFAPTTIPGGPATPVPGNRDYSLCRIDTVQRQEWETSGKPRISEDHTKYDHYGNVTESIQTGDLLDPTDDQMIESHVNPNVNDFIVDRVAYATVSGLVGGQWKRVAETQYEYDHSGDYLAPPRTLGELTRVRRLTDQPNHFADTTYDYDKPGNVIMITGPAIPSNPGGVVVTIQYDCEYARFPERISDPLHSITATWNRRLGQVRSITDANGLTTSFGYDPLGHMTLETYPDGSWDGWVWPSARQWNTINQAVTRQVSDGSPGDGALWETTHFDGLGRATSVEREGGIVAATFAYDGVSSRVTEESSPHFVQDPPAITTYAYDAAGRLIMTRNPDTSLSRVTYGVGTRTVTNELLATTTYKIDTFGRITAVIENRRDCFAENCPIIETATTSYDYDALNRLQNITDARRHETKIAWYMLGQPKSICDPDRGCTSFAWNDDGTLASEQDANNSRHEVTYDANSRPILQLSFDSSNLQKREVRWTWDTDPSSRAVRGASLGHVTQVDDSSAAATLQSVYHYDNMGRVDLDRECIDRKCFELATAFDQAGRIKEVTYPDQTGLVTGNSLAVDYVYGEDGMLESIPGFIANFGHDAAGHTREVDFQNGVSETRPYDDQRGWSDGVEVLRAGGLSLFRQTLVHDFSGHVRGQTIEDSRGRRDDTYTHDDLGRLTDVSSTDPLRNATFQYDLTGNLTFQSSFGNVLYQDPRHVHAATGTTSGESYRYDNVGQLRRSKTMQIDWTEEYRPAVIRTRSAHIEYAYDHEGNRVKTDAGTGVTLQPFPQVEVDARGRIISSIFAEGRRLVRLEGGNPTFLHTDALGSTRLVTDGTGGRIDETDYGVTGTETRIAQTSSNPFHFAGVDADTQTGLAHMNARSYDPALPHFISADPIIGNLYNPQTLNRYAYALNDPVTRADPSGYCVVYEDPTEPSGGGVDCTEDRTPAIGVPSRPAEPSNDSPNPNSSEPADRSTLAGDLPPISEPQLRQFSQAGMFSDSPCPSCHRLAPGEPIREATKLEKVFIGSWPFIMAGAGLTGAGLTSFGTAALSTDIGSVATGASASLTSGEAGAVIGWGTGQSAAAVAQTQAVAEGLTSEAVAQIVARGVTREWVKEQLALYTNAIARGVAERNTQLLARQALMEKILSLWPK
jgi:RHS repeat-associated protein